MNRKELIKRLAGKYKKKLSLDAPIEDDCIVEDDLICKDEEVDLNKWDWGKDE